MSTFPAPKGAGTGLAKAVFKMKKEMVAKCLETFNTPGHKPLGLV